MRGVHDISLQWLLVLLKFTSGMSQTTLLSPEGCNAVETMVVYEEASQYGGMLASRQSTESACKTLCMDSPDCAAVDFHIWQGSCWLHMNTNMTSHNNSSCCNHFKKQDLCQYSCFTIYKDQQPAFVPDAVVAWVEANVTACKQTCVHSKHCHGFVYRNSIQQCYLLDNDNHLLGNESAHESKGNWTEIIGIAEKHDTWIKGICLGHNNDTIITVPSSTSHADQDNEFNSAGRTPLITDFDKENDTETPAGLTAPMVLLIVGATIISTIGLVYGLVFVYQKRKQRALDQQIPNPSSPQHWIKQCNSSAVTSLHNLSKCDQCQGSGLARNGYYHDMFIPMDTYPISHTRQMSPNTPRTGLLAGLNWMGKSPLLAKVLPRPRVNCPISMDYYDNFSQCANAFSNHIRASGQLDNGLSTWPEATVQSASASSDRDAGVKSGKSHKLASKKLTRYEATGWTDDDLAYLTEFGNSDKYYKGYHM